MECWNDGILECLISNKEFFIFIHSLLAYQKEFSKHPIVPKPIIPPFHFSIIPIVSEAN